MQDWKEEARHKILSEAQHLFLERGYDRTSLQMIAEKAGVSKGSLYRCFTSKEELFYELTDSAAARLKALLVRLRGKRFDPATGRREYQIFESEEVISMLLEEKYGLLLIMEQTQGTRYEDLRPGMIDMMAAKIAPMLAVDEENSLLLAQIMARNLIDGVVHILKNRLQPRDVRANLQRLLEYHTRGIDSLLKK